MAASVDSRAVKRYAGALFALANQHDALDQVSSSLQTVNAAFDANAELMVVLLHPRIAESKKIRVLQDLFAGKIKDEVLHLLLLMMEKGRTAQIPYISKEFEHLLQYHRKEADGQVVSAVPLSEVQTQQLRDQILSITGFKVNLQQQVDKSLLGGLIVRVGDHMIDSSAASQLNLLKENFKQVKVV